MKLDIEGGSIKFEAASTKEGDSYTWTTIDDSINPVIVINSNGKVALRRKGTAAVQVRTYLDQGGNRFYSDWSKTNSVKVEKTNAADKTTNKDKTTSGLNMTEKEVDKLITGMKTDKDPQESCR